MTSGEITETETLTVDIVVIGGGGASLAAAQRWLSASSLLKALFKSG